MQQTLPLFYTFNFYVFGIVAVVAALLFVTRKSPVAAAMWLVTTMFALAALFVMLDAQFIGAIQVLVYAGAIMVVFLFVIMLLNLGHPSEVADARARVFTYNRAFRLAISRGKSRRQASLRRSPAHSSTNTFSPSRSRACCCSRRLWARWCWADGDR